LKWIPPSLHVVQSVVDIDIQTLCVHCSECDTHVNGVTNIAAEVEGLVERFTDASDCSRRRTVVVHFKPTVPVDRSQL